MKKFSVYVLALLFVLTSPANVFSEGLDDGCGVGHLESLGEGEYMADSGEIVEMEDIGGGDKMSTGGDIYQAYGDGGDDLATPTGGLLQVDE
jgi:hypothetical protein